MIEWSDFQEVVTNQLKRNIRVDGDPNQYSVIRAPLNQSLFVVAGPGSGKTTAIALKTLKIVFVDEIDPSSIIVTTFMRKAASELRSRILGWGDQLKNTFMKDPSYSHVRNQLRGLDLNRIITGTLDSIAEEILTSFRTPGTPPPIIIEPFVSNALMTKPGLFRYGRYIDEDLKDYIANLRGTRYKLNTPEVSLTLIDIRNRFFHDRVDVSQYTNNSDKVGVRVACDTIHDFNNELQSRLLFDFTRLEQHFLDLLQDGILDKFLQDIKFLLVDEYQDANLLQEQIYFTIAEAAFKKGGSITVVGDDDQSILRFRGATVDLFQAFPERISEQLTIAPEVIYLSQNYRSTHTIVDFCNSFITLDAKYQSARVQDKRIVSKRSRSPTCHSILGMFRDNIDQLASDLAKFIHGVVHGGGYPVKDSQGDEYIHVDSERGSPADVALLLHSPQEFDFEHKPRLPYLLRERLGCMKPPIQIFNPRGRNLQEIQEVQILCGLMLECIDPVKKVQDKQNRLPQLGIRMFNTWRKMARDYVLTNPLPNTRRTLKDFVNAWMNRTPLDGNKWEEEISLIDLFYKLVTWIPSMQNDIEGLVYLEAIARTINRVGLLGDNLGRIVFEQDSRHDEESSIREALWSIFVPIATGSIEVNEDLFETLPPNRVNIMSIHQAKGLEFPLVIVDVGSDLRNLHSLPFKRFPSKGGKAHNMEDEMRLYSSLRPSTRSGRDRAFDDLIRLYFEAYSRAQDVLMLVGLNSVKNGYSTPKGRVYRQIPHVATGWDRDGKWHWGEGLNNLVHI